MVARRSFFQGDFGALALLPNVKSRETVNRAGTFSVMQPNASHAVKAPHNPLWFQFNHHVADADAERRHLGALIIVLSRSVGSKRVAVYRNPGWTRPNSNEILGEFSRIPDLSWDQFAALSRESSLDDAELRKVDDAFGGPWHAIPHGSDRYSWSYRKFWDWAVSEYENTSKTVFGGLVQPDRFRVSARLIAYTPTPRLASDRPVVFDVHAAQGDFVFVAVYSLFKSGQDTQSWYWIQLK